MTVPLSPSVLHGLRLVTLGVGLASSGLLAGRADAQPCAPAPMPVATAATPSGQTAVPRTPGDPLVIVNPRIEIFRMTPDPEPEQLGNSRRWSLHPMAPFVRLEVMTINGDTSSCVARRLRGWDTLQFELVEHGHMAFEDFIIYRDEGPDEAQRAVVVESRHRDLKFKRDDEDSTKRIKASDGDLRIAQIRYGDDFICVANSGHPEDGPCERRGMMPEKVLVRLCTNDSCTAMP
ncbi:MAG TPA: hypothetical protein VMT36_02470 [Candidatus Saccharimonadia bacterium]|nr:hypothetical protein [Candidatus Saccharimonadia bacterium]